MSGGDTAQHPPPQPPPRSGSPFGRFLTSPVLVVALLALVVGFATFRSIGSDGGDASSGGGPTPGDSGAAPSELQGVWTGPATTAAGGTVTVRLTIGRDRGRMRRAACRGRLRPLGVPGDDRAAFEYTERSRKRACPRQTRVTVLLVDDGTVPVDDEMLRLEETLDGATYLTGTLTKRGG